MKKLINFLLGRKSKESVPTLPFTWTSVWLDDFWYTHYGSEFYRYFSFDGKKYVIAAKSSKNWIVFICEIKNDSLLHIYNDSKTTCYGKYENEIARIKRIMEEDAPKIMQKLYLRTRP